MAGMTIWVYSVIHNEAPLLPYFLRHYLEFADRVILFDDHSTDGGPELAMAYPRVTVRAYPGAGLDDQEFVDFAARSYPAAVGQADWCMWVDADEFVHGSNVRGVLRHCQEDGVMLPRIEGYAMFANVFPSVDGQIYDEVKVGVRDPFYDKPVVFDPRLRLSWIPGKHALAEPLPVNRGGAAELKLLHFRLLGERYFTERNARNYARMSAHNVAAGLGYQTYPQFQGEHGWAAQVKALELNMQVVV